MANMEDLLHGIKEFQKNLDKNLDHQDIDDFRILLNDSVDREYQRLKELSKSVSKDNAQYLDYLEGKRESAVFISFLGDELSILALYKKVEIQTLRIIKSHIPLLLKDGKNKRTPYYDFLKNRVKTKLPSFAIENISCYDAFNELRLLNNSIKHDGLVSEDLSQSYPEWGKAGAELKGFGDAYIRLLPEIKIFVSDLVETVYAPSVPPNNKEKTN